MCATLCVVHRLVPTNGNIPEAPKQWCWQEGNVNHKTQSAWEQSRFRS